MFGDKINARTQAELAGIPMIPGTVGTVGSVEEVRAFAEKHGFPIIIKAVNGRRWPWYAYGRSHGRTGSGLQPR